MPPPLPELNAENTPFWTSGRDGRLRFQSCRSCESMIHPPLPRCPSCLGDALEWVAVSGRGVVYARTVNHHRWNDDAAEPYCLALVDIDGAAGVRLTTQIIGCQPESVAVGMAVEVVFVDRDPVFLPYFRLRSGSTPEGPIL